MRIMVSSIKPMCPHGSGTLLDPARDIWHFKSLSDPARDISHGHAMTHEC